MNIAANMLGMGNAATPLGLAAMDEMQRLSGGDTPTRGMVLFVVMNTAAFQLIPSSVVTLRASFGSANPYDIMVHIWFVSIGSLLTFIFVCKLFERLQRNNIEKSRRRPVFVRKGERLWRKSARRRSAR